MHDTVVDLGEEVDAGIAVDWSGLLASKATMLEIAVFNNDSRTTASILRSFKKQHPMRQERPLDELGVPADTYTAERKIVREHFRGVLNGTVVDLKELLDAESISAIDDAERNATIVRHAADIPTKSYVVEARRIQGRQKIQRNADAT